MSLRSPNDMMYGDLGRYPLSVNLSTKCIRYWLKITRMGHSRLPYQAYRMLVRLDDNGKTCWASEVHSVLFRHGFVCVWLNQGVEAVNAFIKCFKQRLVECYRQDWDFHVNNSERFSVYSSFKSVCEPEPYLFLDVNRYIRTALVRFRFGMSVIALHSSRFANNTKNVACPMCKNVEESEVHFILCCPSYTSLRNQYIPLKFIRHPCAFRLSLLLSTRNMTILKNLALFIYYALKKRDILSS